MSLLERVVRLTWSLVLGLQSQSRVQVLGARPQKDAVDVNDTSPPPMRLSELYASCKWRIQLVAILLLNRYREESLKSRVVRLVGFVVSVIADTSAFKLFDQIISTVNFVRSDGKKGSKPSDTADSVQTSSQSSSDQSSSPEMQPSVSVCTTASSSFPPSSGCHFKYSIPQMESKKKELLSTVVHRPPVVVPPQGQSALSPLVRTATPEISASTVESSDKTEKNGAYEILWSATSRNQPNTLAMIASDLNKKASFQFTPEEFRTAASAVDANGYSLLHLAVKSGSEATLKQVLDMIGTEQDQQATVRSAGATKSQFTPLHLAAMKGNISMVERLLSAGADSRGLTRMGCTALHIAAAKGHDDICKVLVANGADVNAVSETKSTPLTSAVHGGHLKVIESLLKNGADPYLRPEGGQTALQIAAELGFTDIVNLFSSRRT